MVLILAVKNSGTHVHNIVRIAVRHRIIESGILKDFQEWFIRLFLS